MTFTARLICVDRLRAAVLLEHSALRINRALRRADRALLTNLRDLVARLRHATVIYLRGGRASDRKAMYLYRTNVIAARRLHRHGRIARTLARLLSISNGRVIVRPVICRIATLHDCQLNCLTFIIQRGRVRATTIGIGVLARVLAPRNHALTVPAKRAVTPETKPARSILQLNAFPGNRVRLITFLARAIRDA